MGSADPRSYSRNKRGIAGSFVWINFDRHGLLTHFRDTLFVADLDEIRADWQETDEFGDSLNSTISTLGTGTPGIGQESELATTISDQALANPWYSDQVFPFDIVVVANNEYGASAKMKIIGVEILNDGLGMSVDDTVIESQSTFVARAILPFRAVKNPFRSADGRLEAGTNTPRP